MLVSHGSKSLHPNGMVVQAGNQIKLGATLRHKCLFAADANFLDGLQTVDGESRTEYGPLAHTRASQADELVVGCGLKPPGAAGFGTQSRLERKAIRAGKKAGLADKTIHRADALPAITRLVCRRRLLATVLNLETMATRGVRFQDVPVGNAMETEQEMMVGLEMWAGHRYQCIEVIRMVEIRRHDCQGK